MSRPTPESAAADVMTAIGSGMSQLADIMSRMVADMVPSLAALHEFLSRPDVQEILAKIKEEADDVGGQ